MPNSEIERAIALIQRHVDTNKRSIRDVEKGIVKFGKSWRNPDGTYHNESINAEITAKNQDEIGLYNLSIAAMQAQIKPEPCDRCAGYREIRQRLEKDELITNIMLNYCPNCGRKLKGGE